MALGRVHTSITWQWNWHSTVASKQHAYAAACICM